jgi:transcriptional activator of cad operon
MSILSLQNKIAGFLNCKLDCNSGHLSVDGDAQKLEPMVHQFLSLLIQHQGELVSKKIVIKTLWPDKEPSDDTLRAMVKKAREALKDNARKPRYIKTVPTKGYLFIPPLDCIPNKTNI